MWSADLSKIFSHYAFQQIFSMGRASWTLDPCKDDKTYEQKVWYLIFLPTTTSNQRKKNNFRCQNKSIENLFT